MKRTNIDWEIVRSRLRASEHALEEALAESPERVENAYRQRAVRLAGKQVDPGRESASLPVLVFRLALATERYAIELKDLAEVLPFAHCAAVPGASAEFLGVINLRGELRAVLDLRRLLGLSENGLSEDADKDSGFVLMLSRPGHEIGLKVDHIEDVREIRPEDLALPARGTYLTGFTSGTLTLLRADAVLAEVFSREQVLTAGR
jgi:chemotaxis signal transduction protein